MMELKFYISIKIQFIVGGRRAHWCQLKPKTSDYSQD